MLVNIPLDLQIAVCTFLCPFDILILRKTCKTLQLVTRRRAVWVAALHQLCFDNTLFLPSFPIPEMSGAELEQAATAPRRWIELCARAKKQHPDDSCVKLCPRAIRIIEDPVPIADLPWTATQFSFVPGGRYIVSYSPHGICVWDIGYTSSAECKLIASVGPEGGSCRCMVRTTRDGMGLIILASRLRDHCSVYEIYPQSKTPQLTPIAQLDFHPFKDPPANLLPDRVIWPCFYDDRIVFRVWNYRVNYSISFSAGVDVIGFKDNLMVIATNTALIVISEEEILVWAVPLLSPGPPNFFDHSPTHIPPLFSIKYPDNIERKDGELSWGTISPWYFGSSQPLYFDMLYVDQGEDSIIHRFEIIIEPDLSAATLHVANTFEFTLEPIPPSIIESDIIFEPYSICEDTLFSCCVSTDPAVSSHIVSMPHGSPTAKMFLPTIKSLYKFAALCPTSGRYVHFDRNESNSRLVVMDFVHDL